MRHCILIFLLFGSSSLFTPALAQQQPSHDYDSLKQALLRLDMEVSHVQNNLSMAEKRFKQGVLLSTIGYSVVIAGGLLLGGDNNDLGRGLLIGGGAMGVAGTFLLVDSFKYIGRAGEKQDSSAAYPPGG